MDDKFISVIVGISSGLVGYCINIFHMQPILRYREVKNRILKEFIYYAQVVNTDIYNDEMKAFGRERKLANRKSSSELSAAILDLPAWYIGWLNFKGSSPKNAAKHLIGYSNTANYDQAQKLENMIRKQLGLPLDE